jgi:DNA repair protein RecN (Recombination protein N)
LLRGYGDGVDASPERLQEVDDRLALLERLKRKYGPTLPDVVALADRMREERRLLTGDGGSIADLDRQLEAAAATYLVLARELSAARRAAAASFASRIEGLLAELAMGRTRFEVRFAAELTPDQWNERGIDQAEFFVSPNPGEDLRPLARIASGGELSRVMLALKTLSAGDTTGKTLIFDEVDAGIGGRVADVVGVRLRALGDGCQVLCITHLPQIAARATTQFAIEKTLRANRTVTTVARLGAGGRIEEIARMIGGAAVSEGVRTSARELLAAGAADRSPVQARAAGDSKQKAKNTASRRRE